MASWNCQLCAASYINLPHLVSHVRASHSEDRDLNFVCQVSHCPRIFSNTNSWYKHVVKTHQVEYSTDHLYLSSSSDDERESVQQCDTVDDPHE
jgi:uncharacterized C2H2 Zn-finger protein